MSNWWKSAKLKLVEIRQIEIGGKNKFFFKKFKEK